MNPTLKCVYAPKDVEFAASDMSLLARVHLSDESVFMEVLIQHRGDVKFEASTRDHRVTCDQPAGNGGSDSGMTPPEYLLVSLGMRWVLRRAIP